MNALELFFLTDIVETGRAKDMCGFNSDLEDLAHIFLAPVRVLWHGRTVYIVRSFLSGTLEGVHHVASFHADGEKHRCRTHQEFHSSPTDWMLTMLSIVCLIPGVIIGSILKVIAHSFPGVRENYQIIKEHFTPDIHIGSETKRVTEESEDIYFEPAHAKQALYNNKVNHLFIQGDGHLVVTARGDSVKKILPKKIILDGASLTRGAPSSLLEAPREAIGEAVERTRDAARELATGKLLPVLVSSKKYECDRDLPKVYKVKSVAEALAHVPPKMPNGKPYHAIYQVVV